MAVVVGTLGPAGLRGAAAALAGRRLSVGTDAGRGRGAGFAGGGGVAGTAATCCCGTEAEAEAEGGAGVAGADTGATSCSDTRLANGTRAYGPGAAGFLNIGFGRGRVGDGEPEGVTTAGGADAETAGRTGAGGRVVVVVVGNLMRTLRDSLFGSAAGRAAVVGSTLTDSGDCSSPSLSSSMISVGSGSGRTRGRGRGTTTGMVIGVGAGTGVGFGTCTGGVASFGGDAGAGVGVGGAGGVGVGCSGARGATGAVSSRVR